MDVASAIHNLSESFISDSSKISEAAQLLPPSTPVRLAKAVRLAASDESFTKEQRALLIKLFSENISIADTYSACPDEEIRSFLVRQALNISSEDTV